MQTKIAVYLASGRPIVATDFGDYQRLLGETGAGLLTPVAALPLAAGILRVLADPRSPAASPTPRNRWPRSISGWIGTATVILRFIARRGGWAEVTDVDRKAAARGPDQRTTRTLGSSFDNAAEPAGDTRVPLTCRYFNEERFARCIKPASVTLVSSRLRSVSAVRFFK